MATDDLTPGWHDDPEPSSPAALSAEAADWRRSHVVFMTELGREWLGGLRKRCARPSTDPTTVLLDEGVRRLLAQIECVVQRLEKEKSDAGR